MNRLEEIQKRMAAIGTEIEQEDSNLDELETELNGLKEERSSIVAKAEQRKKLSGDIASMENVTVIEKFEEKEERGQMKEEFNAQSVEYRNAFLKTLIGEELNDVEKRAFTHTTANTDAVIPAELQNKIYSTMEEAHPLLKDVQVLRTGAVISIVKHVSIDAGDAAVVGEGVANADEQNTFVNVSLSGKDFSKHVDFSYRLGKMSIPAFEQYLVKEIADRIGAAMTRDIVAQIKADLNAGNNVAAATPGSLVMGDFLNGLGALKSTGRVYVYANNATFYGSIASMEGAEGKLSFIPNYQDNISGQVLGKGIKEEDALAEGEVLILDPSQFIYNVVQDVMIERDKDIKKHVHTLSGFAIAEGTLTNDKAGALITVGTAV
jgi:HK97 family phage major capsid protein